MNNENRWRGVLYFLIFLVVLAFAIILVSWHWYQFNKDYEGLLDSVSKSPNCVCECKKPEPKKPRYVPPPVYTKPPKPVNGPSKPYVPPTPIPLPAPQNDPVQTKPPKPPNGPPASYEPQPQAPLPAPQNDPVVYKPPKPFN